MALEHPGAESGVRPNQAGGGHAVGVRAERGPREDAEHERTREVHGEGAVRELAGGTRGDAAVEKEAGDRPDPAGDPDAHQQGERHAVTGVRRTMLVATDTATKPAVRVASAYAMASPTRHLRSPRRLPTANGRYPQGMPRPTGRARRRR